MERHITIQNFRKKYGTQNACLKALLNFRCSEDGLCFNHRCRAPIADYFRPLDKRKAFICRRCLRHFYPMVDSIFDHTHIDIHDWFEIIYSFLTSRTGLSANSICLKYGISYRTVHKMLHSIRSLMQLSLEDSFVDTVVEIDESFLKTGTKGLGRHFKFKRGRGSERNVSVLTMVERGSKGRAKLYIIPDESADTILPYIQNEVDKSTLIFTDSWDAYNSLTNLGFKHAAVNHELEFVNYENSASTNAAENLHSNLKRIVRCTYRSISTAYSQNYASEHAFRHSFRNESDYGFEILLRSLSSLSLTYDKGNDKKAA